MSEQLLKAVIKLFALIAKLDGIGDLEREKINNLFTRRLNKEVINKYTQLFEQYCEEDSGKDQDILVIIRQVSKQINGQMMQQQKYVLLIELTQLIYADHILSKDEESALYIIAEELRIEKDEILNIQKFISGSNLEDFDNSDILIIGNDSANRLKHSPFLKVEGELDGFMIVLNLHTIKPFFIRYIGASEIQLNHLPIDLNKVEIVPAGSTISSTKINSIYFSDLLKKFRDEDSEAILNFTVDDISFKFKNGKIGLRNISFSENSGNLIGVMGSSGSGKSTLLNVLNGNESPSSGQVLINGLDIHKQQKDVEGIIGYVPQDDLLIEDLTVFQNLFYAAKLCFSNLTESELIDLVNKTLQSLGLSETKDLKVGNPLQKTISGGQRKRLNIGLELLREPMVMFVDEPTSGLSSRDSENIMDLLKELTLKGKLIFVVIHQPSSDIFKMFDKLMILDVGGYPIYYGNPVEAVTYFRDAIQLVDKNAGACIECGNVNAELIFNIIETKLIDEYGRQTDQRKTTPESWNEIYRENLKQHKVKQIEEPPNAVLFIPNKFKQFRTFVTRDYKSKLANKQYMLINLLEAPLLAVILAVLVRFYVGPEFRPTRYVFMDNMNIPAYIFMAVIVALFMGLTVSAEEIIKDRKILKRESFLNLSRSSYLISKFALLFALSAIQTGTFVLIGNLILGIQGMFLSYWLVLFSVSCFANVLGLNISSSFNSVVTIYIIIPLLLIPQILLSGVVVQFDQLNPTFGSKSRVPVIGDLMVSRWGYEALMVNQFKNNKYQKVFYDVDKQIAMADYHTVYYIPRLESILEFVFRNNNKPEEQVYVENQFQTLKNELNYQLSTFSSDQYSSLKSLKLEDLDSAHYQDIKSYLSVVKKIHVNRYKKGHNDKEKLIADLTSSPKRITAFNRLKKDYTNDQINSLVFDNKEKTRVLEEDNRLIQQIYPIYSDPSPSNYFDFGALFYVPTKHFMGRNFETVYFNSAIMWVMTFILIVTLYFDVLRRILTLEGRVKPKPTK